MSAELADHANFASLSVSNLRRISSCSAESLYCERMPAPWRLSKTVHVCSEKTLPSMLLPTSSYGYFFCDSAAAYASLQEAFPTPHWDTLELTMMVLGFLRQSH